MWASWTTATASPGAVGAMGRAPAQGHATCGQWTVVTRALTWGFFDAVTDEAPMSGGDFPQAQVPWSSDDDRSAQFEVRVVMRGEEWRSGLG